MDQVIDTREVITWGLLSLSLKIDIMESTVTTILYSKHLNIVKSKLEILEKDLDNIIHPESTMVLPYPCPYVLMYRSYFLNEVGIYTIGSNRYINRFPFFGSKFHLVDILDR